MQNQNPAYTMAQILLLLGKEVDYKAIAEQAELFNEFMKKDEDGITQGDQGRA